MQARRIETDAANSAEKKREIYSRVYSTVGEKNHNN